MLNSFELVKGLRRLITVPDNHVHVSFDVVALFTNVPKENAVISIKNRWDQIGPKTKIPWNEFEQDLRLCLDSTDFKFKGDTYFQKRGLPMGSPLSPILADLVMNDLEVERLSNLNLTVPFYYRYVDDILLALPEGEVDRVLEVFNAKPYQIKFTMEKEIDKTITFLDVAITRNEQNKLSVNWYRKPTWSGRCLNFDSNHPLTYKGVSYTI